MIARRFVHWKSRQVCNLLQCSLNGYSIEAGNGCSFSRSSDKKSKLFSKEISQVKLGNGRRESTATSSSTAKELQDEATFSAAIVIPKSVNKAITKIRNIGIMAHIDAGKTTTTERMLYLSGTIEEPGEVHHGDTVTDYLPQERERGITIQSAVVGFNWANDLTINLIDTPGHVDFTFEVQRALRVVDSAVAILDATAGVEAQTLTVWRQAMDYNLPTLIFLNKMDMPKASEVKCIQSIKDKLKAIPLLLQLPVYKDDQLQGIVDLINYKQIQFDFKTKGLEFTVVDIQDELAAMKSRHELIEQVADLDNIMAEHVIETGSLDSVTSKQLNSAIKRLTLSSSAVPVLLGSAYKHVGVQPLLDGIIKFLPHPSEHKSKEDHILSAYGSDLCAFAFKILHDKQLGPLTFIRMFNGTLTTGEKLYNVTRKKNEKILKVYLPLADDLKEVSSLAAGQVGVVTGLKETITGDTLTTSTSIAKSVQKKLETKFGEGDKRAISANLGGVDVPEPVFFCSVESASLLHQKGLEQALECLRREDPSLHIKIDSETGQTVLSGMGELHLEIIHSRLKTDFKVDADLGKMMVAYKETISASTTQRIKFDRKFADQKNFVEIELELRPKMSSDLTERFSLKKGSGKEIHEALVSLTEKQFKHIENGVESALSSGPKLGFPVINIDVRLNFFQTTKHTSDAIIEAAAANCTRQCLQNSCLELLEPVVKLEIIVDENYQHAVVDDLNRRRFQMEKVDSKHGNKMIVGTAPLSQLRGYSTILRTISSGLGTFSMQFSHYQRVGPIIESQILTELRGF